MSPTNGRDDLYLQIVGLVERLNGHLLVSNEQRASFLERLGSLESAVEQSREKEQERHTALLLAIAEIKHNLGEARDDLNNVPKREESDPRIRLLDPAQYPLRKKEDDESAVALATKLAAKVPASWGAALLKFAVPVVTGAIGAAWAWFMAKAGH